MKTKLLATVALAISLALPLFGSQATITGVLTDDMCTKKHMMPGKPNADCVRECTKHGAKYVVVGDGKVIELQGKGEQLNQLAGQKVKVTGNLIGRALTVTSIVSTQ